MDDAAAVVGKHHKYEEHPKRCRWHSEEVGFVFRVRRPQVLLGVPKWMAHKIIRQPMLGLRRSAGISLSVLQMQQNCLNDFMLYYEPEGLNEQQMEQFEVMIDAWIQDHQHSQQGDPDPIGELGTLESVNEMIKCYADLETLLIGHGCILQIFNLRQEDLKECLIKFMEEY